MELFFDLATILFIQFNNSLYVVRRRSALHRFLPFSFSV